MHWARKRSLWPTTVGLACRGVDMMQCHIVRTHLAATMHMLRIQAGHDATQRMRCSATTPRRQNFTSYEHSWQQQCTWYGYSWWQQCRYAARTRIAVIIRTRVFESKFVYRLGRSKRNPSRLGPFPESESFRSSYQSIHIVLYNTSTNT